MLKLLMSHAFRILETEHASNSPSQSCHFANAAVNILEVYYCINAAS